MGAEVATGREGQGQVDDRSHPRGQVSGSERLAEKVILVGPFAKEE
jgi:hypothetical protein